MPTLDAERQAQAAIEDWREQDVFPIGEIFRYILRLAARLDEARYEAWEQGQGEDL